MPPQANRAPLLRAAYGLVGTPRPMARSVYGRAAPRTGAEGDGLREISSNRRRRGGCAEGWRRGGGD